MTHGLQVTNQFGRAVISENHQSLVKVAGGVLSPRWSSGQLVQGWSQPGKGAVQQNGVWPTTAQVWPDSPARTLYFYKIIDSIFAIPNALIFVKMNVGDEAFHGRIGPNNGSNIGTIPIFSHEGFHTTSPTLEWAAVAPRDPGEAVSGYGMALYGPSGEIRWAANDKLANVKMVRTRLNCNLNHNFNVNYTGWIRVDKGGTVFVLDGVGNTIIWGRFRRTATGLEWINSGYQATFQQIPSYFPNLLIGNMGG